MDEHVEMNCVKGPNVMEQNCKLYLKHAFWPTFYVPSGECLQFDLCKNPANVNK